MPPSNLAPPTPIEVDLPITLGQFVKLAGLAATGGDAKRLIVSGLVLVNGGVERRRAHRLVAGDAVRVQGALAYVVVDGSPRHPTPPGARSARPPGETDPGAGP